MRILLFIDCLGAGGAQRQLSGLSVLLKEKGYDIIVMTYNNDPFYKPYLDDHKIDNYVVAEGINNSFIKLVHIIRSIKFYNPDCLIAYLESPSIISCVAKILLHDFKLIVSERNTTQKRTLKDKLRFFLFRIADYIVPNSYSQSNYLSQLYPWMNNRLYTITNFVDLNTFYPVKKSKNKNVTILIVASIWAPKNTLGLIEAVRLLTRHYTNFIIKWYGIVDKNDNYLHMCKKLINDYNLTKHIYLLDKTKDIASIYRKVDFFCLPSFYEGTPNVICEAIASGCPVICSDVCDNSIYVKDGINGFVFNPNSPDSIANSLYKAVTMPDEDYNRMSAKSREIAELLLNKKVFLKKYIELIEK